MNCWDGTTQSKRDENAYKKVGELKFDNSLPMRKSGIVTVPALNERYSGAENWSHSETMIAIVPKTNATVK
jgi:hypothetical protein